MDIKSYFYELSSEAFRSLKGREVLLLNISGEDSDFCRMNQAKIRQVGSVAQAFLAVRLIDGKKHAAKEIALSLNRQADGPEILGAITVLRSILEFTPEDPHLLFATEVHSTEDVRPSKLVESAPVIERVLNQAKGVDLVGIWASGRIFRGFSNSLGQKNWYDTTSFNFDFSLYLERDKAVTTSYAGFEWSDAYFDQLLAEKKAELALLDMPEKTLKPGAYRAYLGPMALNEITDMLGWGGFSIRGIKTKSSPLARLAEGVQSFHPDVTLTENTQEGIDSGFNRLGFLKPQSVTLVEDGQYKASLVSPRSAREYGLETNGASAGESPSSLELGAGQLEVNDILRELDTGIYINNLWYLNFSDRPAARVTGMTRFAAFWVEQGKRVSPLSVMRFDDSIYRMLGSNLLGLTAERQFILSSGTYGERQTSSVKLPGALVREFNLTL